MDINSSNIEQIVRQVLDSMNAKSAPTATTAASNA